VLRPLSPEHPDDETFEGLLIARPEGRIFFVNAGSIADQLNALVAQYRPRVVALDMSRVPDIEYSALQMLMEGERRAAERGFEFWLVALNPPVLEMVRRSGLADTSAAAHALQPRGDRRYQALSAPGRLRRPAGLCVEDQPRAKTPRYTRAREARAGSHCATPIASGSQPKLATARSHAWRRTEQQAWRNRHGASGARRRRHRFGASVGQVTRTASRRRRDRRRIAAARRHVLCDEFAARGVPGCRRARSRGGRSSTTSRGRIGRRDSRASLQSVARASEPDEARRSREHALGSGASARERSRAR
jgi:anti-anti-sigma regulatory factor